MAGGVQNFEATDAVSTGLGPADFFSLLVSQDEAMARATCTLNRRVIDLKLAT